MRFLLLWAGFAAGLLAALAGCGGGSGELVPTSGTVTLDDQSLANATVIFKPHGNTKGNGGSGQTDLSGRYEVMTPQGKKGLYPGTYKVVISRRLHKDGSVPRPDEPPIESQARETLLPRYSDPNQTELSVNLAADHQGPVDFRLKSDKK